MKNCMCHHFWWTIVLHQPEGFHHSDVRFLLRIIILLTSLRAVVAIHLAVVSFVARISILLVIDGYIPFILKIDGGSFFCPDCWWFSGLTKIPKSVIVGSCKLVMEHILTKSLVKSPQDHYEQAMQSRSNETIATIIWSKLSAWARQ